jgi:hypothetical protein
MPHFASGLVHVGGWGMSDIGANATRILGRFGTSLNHRYWVPPRSGYIMAVSAFLSTGGTATATAAGSDLGIGVTHGATSGTLTAALATIAVGASVGFAMLSSPIAFAAGDLIGMTVIADASWTGITHEACADMLVRFG